MCNPTAVPVAVDVWWMHSDSTDSSVGILDSVELARMRNYRNDAARRRFVAGAALLRRVIAGATDRDPVNVQIDRSCARCGGAHGKPQIVDIPVQASVTHADTLVGVALCQDVWVGLDVEGLTRLPPGADTTWLSNSLQLVAGEWTAGQLLRQWTRLESVVKAAGDGLFVSPTDIALSAPDQPPAILSFADRPDLRFALTDLEPTSEHTGCLAVLTDDPIQVNQHFVNCGATHIGATA